MDRAIIIGNVLQILCTAVFEEINHDHRLMKVAHPVRSAIHKPQID